MAKKRTPKKSASSADPGGFWFDAEAADRAVDFCSTYLRHVKGEWAGQKFVLAAWQRDFVRDLFGWKRPDGTRKYRKALIFVGRKNGKTMLGAAIALYLLLADREPGAEVYSVAADRDQAAIMFDTGKSMVELEPALSKRCEIYRRSIVVPSTASSYHVLSADAPTKHGKNAHGVLFDELHAQPNRELYDVMKTSQGARRQPLFLMFTTAGYDRKSVCFEEYEYACKVRDGIIVDDTYLPAIFEMGKDADWTDAEAWKASNPNLGISPKLEFLQEECKRAQESPAYQNTFRMLYGNQWVEQAERLIDIALWDRGKDPWWPASLGPGVPGSAEESLRGRECYAGLDLARVSDLSAMALVFPPVDEGERWKVLMRFWVPLDDVHKRVHRDRVPYDVWIRDGHIKTTPGNVTDFAFIEHEILEVSRDYDLREVAYDRTFADSLTQRLTDDGVPMVEFGQGYLSMAAPMAELMRLLKGTELQHGGNPVLRWNASNLSAKLDPAGNLKPDKEKSTERIDGIVALVMGIGRAMVRDAGSVYNERPSFLTL